MSDASLIFHAGLRISYPLGAAAIALQSGDWDAATLVDVGAGRIDISLIVGRELAEAESLPIATLMGSVIGSISVDQVSDVAFEISVENIAGAATDIPFSLVLVRTPLIV